MIRLVMTVSSVVWAGAVDIVWVDLAEGGYRAYGTSPWLVRLLGGPTRQVIWTLVVMCLAGGVLVARSPALPIGTPRTTVLTSAGTTDAGPESVHATREGGVVVIGTDYRSEGLSGGGAPGAGCTAALIQVPFQPTPVCADFVRARPLLPATGGVLPAAGSAEIQGRSIGSFAIVSGDVE